MKQGYAGEGGYRLEQWLRLTPQGVTNRRQTWPNLPLIWMEGNLRQSRPPKAAQCLSDIGRGRLHDPQGLFHVQRLY